MWPDSRILNLLKTALPVIQAPMAGANLSPLVIAVSSAGGLGSLPCAMLTPDQMRSEIEQIRAATPNPFNVNFFCHQSPTPDPRKEELWRKRLSKYYEEFGIDQAVEASPIAQRKPFDVNACNLIEELRPPVVSFHFGLPDASLLKRVKAAGATILSTATTVEEAKWLEARGSDAIIAQGFEAGGHRGTFLNSPPWAQVGTMALVPQIVNAVRVPVIAAGGIGDARGIVAAFALGASAVQLGTAYLFSPEVTIHPLHLAALANVRDDATVLTNVYTGRTARGIANRLVVEVGPISDVAPDFPTAAEAVAPLRAVSQRMGSDAIMQMWAGQAAALGQSEPASELTTRLGREALELMRRLVSVTR